MANRYEAPDPFGVELEPHRSAMVIAVHGEVDMISAGQIEARYREVLAAGFQRIVLDLRRVSFLDSSGLHAILKMHAASGKAGVRFALLEGPGTVQRVFDLTNTTHVLRFIEPNEVDWGWN